MEFDDTDKGKDLEWVVHIIPLPLSSIDFTAPTGDFLSGIAKRNESVVIWAYLGVVLIYG
jgi:hypothetical protein